MAIRLILLFEQLKRLTMIDRSAVCINKLKQSSFGYTQNTSEHAMAYFDSKSNVENYIQMSKNYDGQAIIDQLTKHLDAGSRVLELGMGAGKDLDILSRQYQVTGSDISYPFLDLYSQANPQADLLYLNALTMETERSFDAIYSNKSLQYLTDTQLKQSLQRQAERLNQGGLIMHTLWLGDGEDVFSGDLCNYHQPDTLKNWLEPTFEMIDCQQYREMEPQDSFWLLARKR